MEKRKEFNKKDIEHYLRILDRRVKNKTELFLFGGTAMAMRGLKGLSLDMDFIYKTDDKNFHNLALDVCEELGYDPKQLDIHRNFDIGMLRIPDYDANSSDYEKLKLKNLKIKLLNPSDIIISKLCRGNPKDIEDIEIILNSKEVSVNDIRRRLTNLMRSQFVDYRAELDNKVTSFLESYAKRK